MRIQNTVDPHIGAYVVTISGNTESHEESALIFEQYGNRYFLHEVFGPGLMNVNLLASKEEKQILQQTAMLKLKDRSRILIAAK